MADEQQEAQGEPQAAGEFDWEQFFMEEAGDSEEPLAPEPQAQSEDEDDEEEEAPAPEVSSLKKQVTELQRQVAEASKVTGQITQQTKLTSAIEAWKKQASPAELEMADMLTEAKSVDELKISAAAIKRATARQNELIARERQRIEREVQREAGLPVPQTFTPIPDKEKYREALEKDDLAAAAAIAVKDMF